MHLEQPHLDPDKVIEFERVQLFLAARCLYRVEGEPQEAAIGHAGHLDRILKAEKNAGTGTVFR